MPENSEIREAHLQGRYAFLLKYLGLSQEELQEKKIVDAGCGNAALVYGLLQNGITEKAFGFDRNIQEARTDPLVARNITEHDYHDPLPERLKNADVITAFAISEFNSAFQPENAGNAGAYFEFRGILGNLYEGLAPSGKLIFTPIIVPKGEKPQSPDLFHALERYSREDGLKFEVVPTGEWHIKNSETKQDETYDSYALMLQMVPDGVEAMLERVVERGFDHDLSTIGFSREELKIKYKGKKFVDLGCGGGFFINRILHYGITDEAYGVDQNPAALLDEVLSAEHFVQADFLGALPDKLHNADVVTAMSSMSFSGLVTEESLEDYDRVLSSLVVPGGEFRANVNFFQTDQGSKDKVASLDKISAFCKQRGFTFECRLLSTGTGRTEVSEPKTIVCEYCVLIFHKPKVDKVAD